MKRPLVLPLMVTVMLFAASACATAQQGATKIAPTLDEQLAATEVPLVEGYAAARPRLLYGPDDQEALKRKAELHGPMWAEVLKKARSARADSVPEPEAIELGTHYWRIERVQSAALAWFVTGDAEAARGAAAWMVAHCRQPIWGKGYRDNKDLQASWYLYHIAIAYDTLHGTLSEEERRIIRDGLADHARALAEGIREGEKGGIRYDQNHTYIPAVALSAAALALQGEVEEAGQWLKLSWAVMQRCRYALGEDGYYYEGTGYWIYAMHWHARWAEMLSRATGQKLMDLPALRENWRYALLMMLPGEAGVFDIGDTGLWKDEKRPLVSAMPNTSMLWAVASHINHTATQAAAIAVYRRHKEVDYPAAAFLWYNAGIKPLSLEKIEPWHHFKDHDVIAWRSGWGPDDTAIVFRCGPPQGHAATRKLREMKDWTMNSGHVHPDIGGFWIYARGSYLAGDTGYLAEKWTRNHNTLLVGGKGQAIDGNYHNDRGWSYELLDKARITVTKVGKEYAFASGEFSSAYPAELGLKSLRRSVLATKDWMLVIDDMESEKPQTLTWLCHSDVAFAPAADRKSYLAAGEKATLAVFPLGPVSVTGGNERTVIMAGMSPGKPTRVETNFNLQLATEPAAKQRLLTLLVFLKVGEQPPAARLLMQDESHVAVELRPVGGLPQAFSVDLASGEMVTNNSVAPELK